MTDTGRKAHEQLTYLMGPDWINHLGDWRHHVPLLTDVFDRIKPNHGLELGVNLGTSMLLMTMLSPYCQWHGIDAWEGKLGAGPESEGIARNVLASRNVKLHKGYFWDVTTRWPARSFDVVHIDGLHDYLSVSNDFDIAFALTRKGGAILMHDVCHQQCDVPELWRELGGRFEHQVSESDCGLGVLFL